jgi:hypothetical protein
MSRYLIVIEETSTGIPACRPYPIPGKRERLPYNSPISDL